jgi:hypothetical protein
MVELTIRLSDELHRALERTAATQGRSVEDLVQERLARFGADSPAERVMKIVERARQSSDLTEPEALEIAVAETRAHRRGR